MNTQDLAESIAFFRAQLESWPLPGLVPVLARLLAEGEPVTIEEVSAAGGWTPDQVAPALDRHPGVDREADGRIAGFGLTLHPTPHTFTFEDTTVYGFCASDALEFPVLLGRPGHVASPCPTTGQIIHIDLTPHRVVHIDPPGAMVSKLRPAVAANDVRSELCALGHFFADAQAAADWLARYPQGRVVPVADDFEVSRRTLIEIGWASAQDGQPRAVRPK
jgi:alkylmercury lyase